MIHQLTRRLTKFLGRTLRAPSVRQRRRGVRFECLEPRDLLATIDLTPVADNTLYESTDSNISNGAGDYFFAGQAGTSAGLRRGILRFDVASALPADAQIDSVTLTLHMSKTQVGAETIALHQVLADWGEGASNAPGEEGAGTAATLNSATWRYRFFNSSLWPVAGGSFADQASATQTVDGVGFYQWSSNTMAVNVRNWFANPSQQYGWIVKDANESSTTSAKRFDTRENPNASFRPVVTINYSQITNHSPTLVHPIDDQILMLGQSLQLNLPSDTFVDTDPGQTLTFLATLQTGSPLPSWLTFNESTLSFQGTPTSDELGIFPIALTAFDSGQPQKSTTANFTILAALPEAPWQNPNVRQDVDADGFIAPLDALRVINQLNEPTIAAPSGLLPPVTVTLRPTPYVDVNGDGFLTPLDALVVINYLNGPPPAAEGEAAPVAVDANEVLAVLLAEQDVRRKSRPTLS